MVRLSIFSNGIRLGPSSSLLSMSVPTWEARFEELDVIQSIGKVRGMTTGILFRKSQSHEWVIFWTFHREDVLTAFEHLGLNVSREPVRLRVGSQLRVNEFIESELQPMEPSRPTSGAIVRPLGASSPMVFATPLTSTTPDVATMASDDKKWPGAVVYAIVALFILSMLALVLNLFPRAGSAPPGPSNDGGVTTVSIPVTVATIDPSQWRTTAENNVRYLQPPLAGIPNAILHLRYDYGVTEDSLNLLSLTSTLGQLSINCATFHDLSVDAPSPVFAMDAENVSVACTTFVNVDQADLTGSNSKWTPKLASNDQHWLRILKERVAVLKNGAAN